MDCEQRLIPAGVLGELVAAGDHLASGYLDPIMANKDSFIHVSNREGQSILAYHTVGIIVRFGRARGNAL